MDGRPPVTDLSQWPKRRRGVVKARDTVYIPPDWIETYRRNCLHIQLLAGAENDSHAIHLAVHEMAERLRKEEGH